MAAEQEQSSSKLVYLRDHAHRYRTSRATRRSLAPPPNELATEGMWLGRALAAVAGTVFLHWTGMLGGGTHAEGAETWRWTTAHALPHLFLACMAALSARSLLRGEARVEPRTGVVGGALIVLALEGLTLAMIGGDLDELSLSVRTDVLVQTAALAVGIWASSFALRSHRQSVTT